MRFVCPHCGANAVRLTNGPGGNTHAECLRCGKVAIVSPPDAPHEPRAKAEREPSAW
jgi:predicted RNA-binding Zn-ribbon protein involved in translation (DUF1610 family)